ncbi:hypothetical protein [Serratia ureilytica]|nr:hypothetical protein [Serratia ureilytica]
MPDILGDDAVLDNTRQIRSTHHHRQALTPRAEKSMVGMMGIWLFVA